MLLLSVDECYHAEAPFQVFWFVVNFSITVVLTILIKKEEVVKNTLKLDLQNVLNMKAAVIDDEGFFILLASTIFVTGILSLLLFFLMKHFQSAQSQFEKFWLLVNLNSRTLPRKNLCV